MDFFSSQESARKRTKWLVLLFALAVVLIIAIVYLVVMVVLIGAQRRVGFAPGRGLWDPPIFAAVAAVTSLVILLGSLYKIAELSGGGEAVARMLGARVVDPNTRDPNERRLLNVVEEMAIAAGLPVPAVFVLPAEKGINAFAAGFTPRDAVIAVTRGCLRILSRDELQGVIGHEFSHILNGDTRVNIRLMGVIHGILLISLIGYMLMRTGGRGRRSGGQVVLLGLALFVIGYVGIFFGRIIKAAVSREREYLADASSVQFTRNPGGISGALKKIGGLIFGSRVDAPNAEEASHLFFGNALKRGLVGLTATHPPLAERIRRIDPGFDGTFPVVTPPAEAAGEAPAGGTRPEERTAAVTAGLAASGAGSGAGAAMEPRRVADRVGTLDRPHIDYAARLIVGMSDRLRETAHEPAGAQAIVYALLLDRGKDLRSRQLAMLQRALEPFVYKEMASVIPEVDAIPPEVRLPLIDVVVPSLRRISLGQFQAFYENVQALARADDKLDLFEYTLQHILLRRVAPSFAASRPAPVKFHSLAGLAPQCSVLLSTLAHNGQERSGDAEKAFRAGAAHLGEVSGGLTFRKASECDLNHLERALEGLACAAPVLRRKLVEAVAACVAYDRKITVEEAELLRAVGDALDCPSPPFLPGQEI